MIPAHEPPQRLHLFPFHQTGGKGVAAVIAVKDLHLACRIETADEGREDLDIVRKIKDVSNVGLGGVTAGEYLGNVRASSPLQVPSHPSEILPLHIEGEISQKIDVVIWP